MKPVGPIPPEFAAALPLIAGRPAAAWVEGRDTPVFVYDLAVVRARVARLRAALPEGVAVHYAVKANPFPPLVQALAELTDGLDVASAGELALALDFRAGTAISFAGPGKRDAELEAAIRAGATINLESEGEADRALATASRIGLGPRLALRVNPPFELRGSGMRMGGRASPFGVDAERAGALARRVIAAGADWRGWHIFAGSQSLDTAAIIETQGASLVLAERLSEEAGGAPPLVNLGGGFGIPYFAGDTPIDVGAIGAALGEAIGRASLPGTRFALELGRWLVGEAGVYLARVIDRKESGGETFLVTDGGMHHQLAASGNLGAAVRRNYPVAIPSAPADAPPEVVSIVGPLCTPLDRLADRVALPRAGAGDVVAVFAAGAYGLTASPTGFLGHPLAAEILVDQPSA
ncbi:pyridoxal-dependent decarboxylase, exosortase A system-associated [Sphingomonas aracearum]|uniref:Pyridoxal-dependent decarboxylase, exosortase A system-associated n=1 Tax=Sphingomonas aracearum TaxID=2283317 RepID=A0A369VZT9_9SPHN|nr:pyridoxal-dependent decarboxylase, exosortase A system-associated [Sphingomonas aracearum]RDE06582.1 pyridoxal-dependent decarboxylase, exosortase A system-associated [Sphingomonas aracearum]